MAIAFVFLSIVVPNKCFGPNAGKMHMITEDADPILWSRARDAALIVKDDAMSQINSNGFALMGDYIMYPFGLVECGVQVEFPILHGLY